MRDVIYWEYLSYLFCLMEDSLLVQNREWCIKSDTLNVWSLNSSLKATARRLIDSAVDRPLIQTKICSQKVKQKNACASKQQKPIKCVNSRRIKDLTSKQIDLPCTNQPQDDKTIIISQKSILISCNVSKFSPICKSISTSYKAVISS